MDGGRSPRASRATLATGGLAAALATAGVTAVLSTDHGRILALEPAFPPLALLLALAAAFGYAELALLHVELRRQAYSFSLSGIALLLGVLFCDLRIVLLARVSGAAAAFAWQKMQLLKAGYNVGAYVLEIGVVGFCLHRILGPRAVMTLPAAVLCYLVLALVDVMMSALVLLVISWHQGRITGGQALRVFVPASILSLFSTISALEVTVLHSDGALGGVLIIGFTGLLALLYRAYLSLRHRHQSLAVMHEFVEPSVDAPTVEELAEVLLGRIRRLLNAGAVQLILHREPADLVLRINEEDSFSVRHSPVAGRGDPLLLRVSEYTEAIVIPRSTRERSLRVWLINNGARDAMLVPLPSGGIEGTLIVTDRMGEAATFRDDDLTILQTLAGHLAVALRSTQLVQQLRHDASHDALTGLANRVLLTERIEQALQSAELADRYAVLLLDLDKFKEVNDALGHHVGDALLRVVGSRIRDCVPAGGTVARLGGDEFAVLLPPVLEGAAATTESQGLGVADAVLTALLSPIDLPEAVLSTRASIGIAFGSPGCTGADLLRHADTAMYAAKAGESPVVAYTEELDHGRAERLTMLADLALALERDEFELRYQPQLDLHSEGVRSVEALVRWRHPERGLLTPDEFVPLAESSGLIGELTHHVLRQALRQCRRWRDEGLDLTIAVNLSAYSVNNAKLAEDVALILAEVGLSADRLVMEITESCVMGDPRRTVPILQRLADIGVTLSLDDFGTGYSSLAYLQKLPVREVKIDKSFVMGLTGGQAHASSVLVRSILTLGGNLALRVVAEGVEDDQALELLRELGCDVVQGYYIAHPLPAAEISAFVDRYRPSRHPLPL